MSIFFEQTPNNLEYLKIIDDHRRYMWHPLVIQGQILLILLYLINNIIYELNCIRTLIEGALRVCGLQKDCVYIFLVIQDE